MVDRYVVNIVINNPQPWTDTLPFTFIATTVLIVTFTILDESLNPDPIQNSGTPYSTSALNNDTATTNRMTSYTSNSNYGNNFTSHNSNIINNNVDKAYRSSTSINGRKNRGSETLNNSNRGNNNNSNDSVGVNSNYPRSNQDNNSINSYPPRASIRRPGNYKFGCNCVTTTCFYVETA
uniref:Uncharacterized protein n=1 Tax=Octopus bimaculoides TaxID=37653 RepID=A0A0L8FUZ6_OCTBM